MVQSLSLPSTVPGVGSPSLLRPLFFTFFSLIDSPPFPFFGNKITRVVSSVTVAPYPNPNPNPQTSADRMEKNQLTLFFPFPSSPPFSAKDFALHQERRGKGEVLVVLTAFPRGVAGWGKEEEGMFLLQTFLSCLSALSLLLQL